MLTQIYLALPPTFKQVSKNKRFFNKTNLGYSIAGRQHNSGFHTHLNNTRQQLDEKEALVELNDEQVMSNYSQTIVTNEQHQASHDNL